MPHARPLPTKTIWVNAQGEKVPVKSMSLPYLRNTISILQRIYRKRLDLALSRCQAVDLLVSAEMASLFADRELEHLSALTPIEYMELVAPETFSCYCYMLEKYNAHPQAHNYPLI